MPQDAKLDVVLGDSDFYKLPANDRLAIISLLDPAFSKVPSQEQTFILNEFERRFIEASHRLDKLREPLALEGPECNETEHDVIGQEAKPRSK